jgi:peptidoglycan/LPS O-acetylase OafA/YrhL
LRVRLGNGVTLFVLSFGLVGFCATEPVWSRLDSPLLFTAINASYGVCIAALVCSIACCRNAVVIGLLETGWLVSFGRISYGFYLYHNLIPDLTRNHHAAALFGGTVPVWAHVAGIAGSFVISLGMAMLSWRLIEEPILRLKTQPAPEAATTLTSAYTPAPLPSRRERAEHSSRNESAASDAV